MHEPNAAALGVALKRALKLYDEKTSYQLVQKRGMETDFSWKNATVGYERLYNDAL